MSNSNYSFEEWCIDNNRNDILERWDYKKNQCAPSDVGYMSNNKYYFICPENKHDSTPYTICDLHKSRYPRLRCKKCSSFAQAIIDKYGEEHLGVIWNKQNIKSPWDVTAHSNKKFYFNCVENPSHVYDMTLDHYINGVGCPYCSHHRINETNSLAVEYPKILEIWSDKNITTPYEYAPHSTELVWWKCNNGIHEDYQRTITHSNSRKFICPECGKKQSQITRRDDITGEIFGELTALYIDEKKSNIEKHVFWKCKCSCGNECSVSVGNLKYGKTTTCGNRAIHYSGRNNGNWKGGKTSDLQIERCSSKYNEWRNNVYKNNLYTCQCCGRSKNINKNAHHINNFLDNEDLRYDLSNGMLLCDQCHAFIYPTSFHYRYGTRNNSPEQLEEYINTRRKELNINKPFKMIDYLNGDVLKPNSIKIGENNYG